MTDYVLDGRYELIERIATGGMGEVWRGADQILGRPVAIKMLAQLHAEDPQFRARFRAEARYASSLSHPGITRVFDYGENSPLGGPYLVMELVDGQPLSEILERHGRLDPYVVLDIIAQAAWALENAHQAGIVHRDIKPGNLLIKADGTTKITDFGIAKANMQAVNLTATGIVMGTALYVSPEQATGSPLTGSSDIYSLGVVAYECLAGDPPFVADQPLAIAIMHKHDPVPPLPAEIPRPIADLVYGMLAKTPDGRPESARHVADRAEVIRDARQRSGYDGPVTSDLPVVPNFPETRAEQQVPGGHGSQIQKSHKLHQERVPGGRRRPRGFLLAGIGAAACGVIALVALLLSSGGTPSANVLNTSGTPNRPGSTSASKAIPPENPSQPGIAVSDNLTGTNLMTVIPTSSASSSSSSSAPSSLSPSSLLSSLSPTLTGPGSSLAPSTPTTPPTTSAPSAPASTSTTVSQTVSPPATTTAVVTPPPTTSSPPVPPTTPAASVSPTTPTPTLTPVPGGPGG